MKEGAARTSGPLFLYNVSELEKVPLTGPLARFPQGVEVGGCTIGISGPDLPSAAFRVGADIGRNGPDGGGMLFRASPLACLDENLKKKIHQSATAGGSDIALRIPFPSSSPPCRPLSAAGFCNSAWHISGTRNPSAQSGTDIAPSVRIQGRGKRFAVRRSRCACGTV